MTTNQSLKMTMSPAQPDLIQAMHDPEFYAHEVSSLEMRETHISWVFLTGPFVYKVKKPVDMGFLDFTTLKKREYYCRREVELNRRLTSGIYLGVVPITGSADGGFELDGDGETVETAVKMKQLSADDQMQRMLSKNNIETSAVERLARTLCRFYDEAATGPNIDAYGSWDAIAGNCAENFRQIAQAGAGRVDRRRLQIIEAATTGFLTERQGVFEERVENGRIRDGHGDLRTDHIYFTADGIQIIDCIEFNQRFRFGDLVSDLAFLAMALDHQGYPRLGGNLVTALVDCSGDRRMLSLLDFYKCYRAMVKVKVNCLRLGQKDLEQGERSKIQEAVQQYLDLAFRYAAQFSRPTVWVVCGLVATGKSTIARALADSLCIDTLRSDLVRKQLFDRTDQESGIVAFHQGIYSPQATALTYGKLLRKAQAIVEKGRSVVLDATFGKKDHRREALRLAAVTGARIRFVECVCRESTIRQRLSERTAGTSVSDARLEHLERIKQAYQAPEELPARLLLRVHTETSIDDNLKAIFSRMATLY